MAVSGRSQPAPRSSYKSSTVSGTVRPMDLSFSTCANTSRGAPSMATRPSFITITRSACSASFMWWVMSTTVMPFSRFSL